MKVACPSCQALFEADAEPAAGPGLLLCEACSLVGDAPPLPIVPASPTPRPEVSSVISRRRRPRVPELSFRRREEEVEVAVRAPPAPVAEDAPAPVESSPRSSEPMRVSLEDLEVTSSRAPVVHDGGFTRQERAISVFPCEPGPMSKRGAELSADDFSSDVEPVSLHDLGIVLAPVAAPPPWSGGGGGKSAGSGAADLARMAELCPAPVLQEPLAPPVPDDVVSPPPERVAPIPPPPAEAKGEGSRDAADSGIVDLRRIIAAAERRQARPAPASERAAEKPSFFRVDSVPPPRHDSIPVVMDDDPPPSSSRADLLSLVALPSDRPRARAAEELLHLRGGLFGDVSPHGSYGPLPPPDATLLAPVLSPERVSRTSVQPPVGVDAVDAPRSTRPPRPSAAPPATPSRAPKSGAPGPVVSERRAAPAAVLWRSGVAGWAVVLAGVAAASVALGFRLGSTPAPAEDTRAVVSTVTTTLAVMPPERPVARAVEARLPVDASPPTAVASAPKAPPVRAPEPARLAEPPVRERAVAPPPPVAIPGAVPPPPPPVAPAPPPVAPVVQAPPPAGGAEFDRGAAKAALAAAASAAGGCKQGDDPSGGARVSITFAPSGRVTSARILSGPFQGTPTGGCIAQTFRAASVPPFSGDPVTVTREVSVH